MTSHIAYAIFIPTLHETPQPVGPEGTVSRAKGNGTADPRVSSESPRRACDSRTGGCVVGNAQADATNTIAVMRGGQNPKAGDQHRPPPHSRLGIELFDIGGQDMAYEAHTQQVKISLDGYEYVAEVEYDDDSETLVGLYPVAQGQNIAHLLFTHGAHDIDFRDIEVMAINELKKRGEEAAAADAYDAHQPRRAA